MQNKLLPHKCTKSFLAKFKKGDHDIFRKLIDNESGFLISIAFRQGVPSQDVPDIIQEAWMRIYTYREAYCTDFPIRSWIHKIFINLIVDYYRENARHRNRVVALLAKTTGSWKKVGDNYGLDDKRIDIACIFSRASLTVRERQAMYLRYVEDLAISDIAQVMFCKSGTVKATLAHALAKLRNVSKKC